MARIRLSILLWVLVMAVPATVAAQGEGIACAPEPAETAIAYGAVVVCESEALSDVDAFRFRGLIGERIVMRLTGANHCIQLNRPDGSKVYGGTRCEPQDGRPMITPLDATGTFVIQVTGGTASASYTLVLDLDAPYSYVARPICAFCTLSDAIDPEADVDTFQFDAAVGDMIKVTALSTSGGSPCIELFGPRGGTFGSVASGSCSGSGGSQIEPLAITLAGRYTVVVRGLGKVDYTIRLECSGICLTPPRECRAVPAEAWYANGQDVVANVRFSHRDAGPLPVEAKLWLERPNGARVLGLVNLGADGTLVLSSGYDRSTVVTLGTVNSSLPRGLYRLGCRLVDPVKGALISETISPFRVQ